jgi:hypothetical protein
MNRAGEKQALNFLIEIVNEMDVWIGGGRPVDGDSGPEKQNHSGR